ncbi:MAG TPA: cytochrome P450 [Thermoleophilaceae bacterium]|nr:cytochrome P450 [Thermoleophilaceae bacterium]
MQPVADVAPVPGREPAMPPGPRLPAALQTARWAVRPLPFLQQLQRRHGDVFSIQLFHEDPWVMLSDPELVKRVLTAPADILHAGEGNQILEPILGPRSVLLLDEDAHLRQRRLLLPPFHGDRMERYGEVMRAVVEDELARWPAGVAAPAWPRMQAITLEVILRAVFGVTERAQLDPLRVALREMLDFMGDNRRMVALVLAGPRRAAESRLLGFRKLMERADELVLAQIARHRGDDLEGREDVLSLLLQARHEDGTGMSDAELRDELMTLLVAGHETTATALGWTIERLVRHPEALERTVAEADDGGGPYTEAVIQEALRLRPVIPVVARHVKQPFELGDHLIPVGATITPSILLMHRRPDVYPDPPAFRPERFLEQPPGTYTWIPFGGGVRRCIGASFALFEMRVVLSTLLSRATLRADDPRRETTRRRAITLTPSRGARVVLAPS